uniref:Thioredoxin domain-containing protein n=1 Tax=Panagrellus redivivus TaxID=6233 RepID=A0A7E4W5B1_PANRE
MSFLRALFGVRSLWANASSPARAKPFTRQVRAYSDDLPNRVIAIEDYDQFRDEVLHSPSPVLVAFHADWSGPCQMYLPRVETAILHYDPLSVAKVNIDYCGDLAEEFGVEKVPTLIGFAGGEEISRNEGVLEEDHLYNLCEQMLQFSE